jgi:hypothetical protein
MSIHRLILGVAILSGLPGVKGRAAQIMGGRPDDWLIHTIASRATVVHDEQKARIVMENGLIRRTFILAPDAATCGFDNLMSGQSILRGVKPEAVVEIHGKKFDVGGLLGQPDYAYLKPQWLSQMTRDPAAFAFASFEVGKTVERFAWKPRHGASGAWPPPGVSLTLKFTAPADAPGVNGVAIAVHYEMYDGIPLLAKWITIQNDTQKPIEINSFISEMLAVVEHDSSVDEQSRFEPPDLCVVSDYTFHGMDPRTASQTTRWVPDPQYLTQVNYERKTPCLLESTPPIGPDVILPPGKRFDSFRTFELAFDSTDRERNGLAVRRMFRLLAPWCTENPILMHVTQSRPAAVKAAIDQCAEVGFEMVIMSFGSGFNVESRDPKYIAQIRELVQYANSKGIDLGGYSLLASRGDCGPENEVINPATHKPGGAIFGHSPCLGSQWGQEYFRKLYAFCEATGLNAIEHDGSYPGDVCAATDHPGHRGLEDSQWTQWKTITDFYEWCRWRGIYLNVPDFYFLNGSSKVGMGYRETNWSLPREQQIIHARQNIYDGTWEKTPSMGWMFVPLTQYHGGGAAATIEPLHEHLDAYEAHLANLFSAGVQACYRGPRLYDTEQTRGLVKKWVDFYKSRRAILDSDIIHVRRADGRDIDCILHVNPMLPTRGLAMVYNPLDEPVHRQLKLPVYYTGLSDRATIRIHDGEPETLAIDRQFSLEIPIDLPAHGYTWIELTAIEGG